MDTTKDLPLGKLFKNFILMDYKNIVKEVKDTPSRNCKLGPIQMEILKEIIPQLLPLITAMVNSWLKKGIFPSSLKKLSSDLCKKN